MFVGISLGRAVPDEVWFCGHCAGDVRGLPLDLCGCLAPGILPAVMNVVWVLLLYFGSRLSSHPAGQTSSNWILWCPRECQKALVPVAAACFGWENSFLSLLFEFSIYSRLGQKRELCPLPAEDGRSAPDLRRETEAQRACTIGTSIT